jgi:hypothetical protein
VDKKGGGGHLLVKVSVNRFVSTRVEAIRNYVEADIRRLRKRTISRLDEVFNVAARVARCRTGHQRVNGKMTAIGLVQRKRWFRVAEHAALTIQCIASNVDEKEILSRLNELKRAVDEAKVTEQSRSKNNRQSSD